MGGLKILCISALMLTLLASSAVAAFVPADQDGQEIMNEVQQQGMMEIDEEEPTVQEFEDDEPNVQEFEDDEPNVQEFENDEPNAKEMAEDDTDEADMEEYRANTQEDDNGATMQEKAESQIRLSRYCYRYLYIMGFTSGRRDAQTRSRQKVLVRHSNGRVRQVIPYKIPNVRNKGVLWKISFSRFHFRDSCITRSNIRRVTLKYGSNDGWNIDSVVSFLRSSYRWFGKIRTYYRLLSTNFNIYRWLDGNQGLAFRTYSLTLR